MAVIRTQNGRVLLKDGRVACECCAGGDIDIELSNVNFGETGECDCETVLCYNATTNPSPASITVGGFEYVNATPGTDKFAFNNIGLTGPIYDETLTNVVGWTNRVSEPSIMELEGTVGGDVEIFQLLAPGSAGTWNGITIPPDISAAFNSTYRINGVVPFAGEFPCGVCPTPRNGPHAMRYIFVMIPNTFVRIRPISYLECFPWYRLRLRKLGPFTPP